MKMSNIKASVTKMRKGMKMHPQLEFRGNDLWELVWSNETGCHWRRMATFTRCRDGSWNVEFIGGEVLLKPKRGKDGQ